MRVTFLYQLLGSEIQPNIKKITNHSKYPISNKFYHNKIASSSQKTSKDFNSSKGSEYDSILKTYIIESISFLSSKMIRVRVDDYCKNISKE